jgi:hypothetical protein
VTDIVIRIAQEEFKAKIDDTSAPHTARRVLAALPIQATAKTWGDEIYFEIPVDAAEEDAQATVRKGDLGYWPAGNCFCIFYGRTPMSPSETEIVPASPVNVIGRVENPDGLKGHAAGEPVTVRLAE